MFTRGEPVVHIMFKTGTPFESYAIIRIIIQNTTIPPTPGKRAARSASQVSPPSLLHLILQKKNSILILHLLITSECGISYL